MALSSWGAISPGSRQLRPAAGGYCRKLSSMEICYHVLPTSTSMPRCRLHPLSERSYPRFTFVPPVCCSKHASTAEPTAVSPWPHAVASADLDARIRTATARQRGEMGRLHPSRRSCDGCSALQQRRRRARSGAGRHCGAAAVGRDAAIERRGNGDDASSVPLVGALG